MSRALRVAVLGAGGTIAGAIVRDLAESDEVEHLALLDLDGRRAAAVAAAHGLGRASAAAVDANELDGADGLVAALADCDMLVNAASYRINLQAMQAALRAGCHYLDLGGLYWMTGRQLELHDSFASAGLLAVLGIGSSPGKTNVMALRAVRELGGLTAERIVIGAASRDPVRPNDDRLRLPYSLQTLLDELTLAPVVLRDGKPVEIEPLTDGGELMFPEPVGRQPTINTLHSELRTFAESFGCAQASFHLSLSHDLRRRLEALAGSEPPAIAAAAAQSTLMSPKTVSAHVVEASDGARTVRMTALTSPMERWGLGGGVVSTAAPAAATVRLLARGRLDLRGVHPPERCIDPDDLFAELERRGCRFAVAETAQAVR